MCVWGGRLGKSMGFDDRGSHGIAWELTISCKHYTNAAAETTSAGDHMYVFQNMRHLALVSVICTDVGARLEESRRGRRGAEERRAEQIPTQQASFYGA